jgi:hypothetical protein
VTGAGADWAGCAGWPQPGIAPGAVVGAAVGAAVGPLDGGSTGGSAGGATGAGGVQAAAENVVESFFVGPPRRARGSSGSAG